MGLRDKSGNIPCFSSCQNTASCAEPNQQQMLVSLFIVCVSKAWYLIPPAPLWCKKLLKTHQWATPLYWVTRSFVSMNTRAVVYFDSIPHTPCRCPEYSLGHQIWINQPLKTVANKCSIYCLSNIWQKLQWPDVWGNYWPFLKIFARCFRQFLLSVRAHGLWSKAMEWHTESPFKAGWVWHKIFITRALTSFVAR